MKVFGQLEKAQLENIATGSEPASAAASAGRVWFNTTLLIPKLDTGAGLIQFVMDSAAQALSNKTISDALIFAQIASPSSPSAGFNKVYVKADGNLYIKSSAGVEKQIGAGGAGALRWELQDNAPLEASVAGCRVLDFDYQSSQEIWAHIQVPESYVAGTQIKLKGGVFATSAVAGKVLFKATAYLLQAGTTVLGTFSNSRASTNAEVTAAGVASKITAIGDIDLTDASGQINGVSVAAGDIVLVKIIRDTASESSPAAADARLLRDSFIPKFA